MLPELLIVGDVESNLKVVHEGIPYGKYTSLDLCIRSEHKDFEIQSVGWNLESSGGTWNSKTGIKVEVRTNHGFPPIYSTLSGLYPTKWYVSVEGTHQLAHFPPSYGGTDYPYRHSLGQLSYKTELFFSIPTR